jgi:transcriptional regulator with XRE-family HTH domain
METFGQYIKRRRKELGLRQKHFEDFTAGYISNIERGESNPTIRTAIQKLARTLQIPDSQVDWLWMYSILDYDPIRLLETVNAAQQVEAERYHVQEPSEDYSIGIQIQIGDTPETVIRKLGSPTERLQGPTKMKWIYQDRGIHIVFVDSRVIDVDFK